MTTKDILLLRLDNQQLTGSDTKTAKELTSWFGAVQSQDFPGAIWALGQRLNYDLSDIENAYRNGEILRTHVMRPTWHFVSSDDIYWLLELTSEKVLKIMRSYQRNFGIDEKIAEECIKILQKELNGNHLTRKEIGEIFTKSGINLIGNGLAHIMGIAEAKLIITSGPNKGKLTTYALLNQRVKNPKSLKRNEAIIELTKRYFQSHGPAQIKDFTWWSGLTVKETMLGIEANKKITSGAVEGKTYYFFPADPNPIDQVYLLPNYDEYTVAYADRDILAPNINYSKLDARQNALFNNAVVVDGKVEGIWRKIPKSREIELDLRLFRNLNSKEKSQLDSAIEKYSKFLNIPVKPRIS